MTPEVKEISMRLWGNDVWRPVAEYDGHPGIVYLSMPYAYIRIWLVSSFEHAETNGGKLWPPDGVEADPFFELADCLLEDGEDHGVVLP
jgi:hypothetical protein